ncbi:hypothetical protein [Streptosporangium sp. NPDC087985]|uniref:hypothetical protein n=1 Tax=Streptosporangium sp. NPDC087985 TaxID=3366196 RepID=UPI00380A9DB2
MTSYAGLRSGVGKAMTVTAYVAAVAFLTWTTINNHLGDQLYGRLLMIILSFPISIIDWFTGDNLFAALRRERYDVDTTGWDYMALSWPGGMTAIVVAILMTLSRTQRVGRMMGWLLTAEAVIAGVVIVIDQWGPRRSWGWPLIACGIAMAAGLLLSRRKRP